MYLDDGCGIQMSQATPAKFSMLILIPNFSENLVAIASIFLFFSWPYCATVLEATNKYGVAVV